MINRVIITGSGGMLGSALLKELSKQKEIDIIAVSSQADKLSEMYKNSENVTVARSLHEIDDICDSVCVNCAFPRTQNGYTLANAMLTTEKAINELSLCNCKYFINISSQSVYPQDGDDIQAEGDTVCPQNLYGMTKFAIEQITRLVCDKLKMEYVNIRLGSLASAEFDQRMINRFFENINKNHDIFVDGGSPKVSYLHVEDAIAGLTRLVDYTRKGHKVDNLYNLANNDWMFIKDLALLCVEKARSLNIGNGKSQIRKTDKISAYNNIVNSSKFYKDFDWTPQYAMVSIVEDIFNIKHKDEII